MTPQVPETGRPPLHLIDDECDRIASLALSAEDRAPAVCRMLMEEIDRAEVHGASDLPPGVVSLMSKVEFVDESTGTRRTVELVYPAHADIDAGKISILTPVGAGLIGLSEGQSILWPDREGREHRLRIVRVERPQSPVS
jgi:regulator of nucleoside diphosphate kinase